MTGVALAFIRSDTFNTPDQHEWQLFTTIDEVRAKFPKGTIVQVAIGGWGDKGGFSKAAKTAEGRKLFANNVKAMLDATGADGMLPLLVSRIEADADENRHRRRLGVPRW